MNSRDHAERHEAARRLWLQRNRDHGGIGFSLEKSNVGVIVMGSYEAIEEGSLVRATGEIASVPVGPGLIG